MTKSACGTRLTQIFLPLMTQSLPSLRGAGDHAGGIATGTRLRDGDRRLSLAACVRFQIFAALFRIGRCHQHVQVGAVGRKGERDAGAALFLIHADQRDGGKVGAAEFLRHVEAPQTELPAFAEQRCFFFGAQSGLLAGHLAREHRLLQGHDIAVDELRDQVLQHTVFFGELEHCRCHSFSMISASAIVRPDPSCVQDHRIELHLGYPVAIRERGPRQIGDQLCRRRDVDRRRTAEARQQLGGLQAAQHLGRLGGIDRGRSMHHVAHQLHHGAAQPHHHDRTERRVVHHADDQLMSSWRHLLHQHAFDARIRLVAPRRSR